VKKLILLAMLALPTSGHDVITTPITFSREISRLFYSRCASCHRPGGSAFSLLTYQDARPWAEAIKEEVLERRMPPWGAVKGFGDFRDDQGLTQEQLELIAEWVEGGVPEGNPVLLPKTPEFEGRDAAAPAGREVAVDGSVTITSPLVLTGIRPKEVAEGASLMVVADRPDGSVEPLLWLYNFKPKFARAYQYSAAVRLPAGTRVEVSPRGGGTVALIEKGGRQ
jgi:hypothetical protein